MEKGFIVTLLLILASVVEVHTVTVDVTSYNNPMSDGSVDISQDFLKAWKETCSATEASSITVPEGTFLLNPIRLEGPCKAPIELQLQGTLKAPEDPNIFNKQAWLTLIHIDQLTISGGGTIDGVGSKAWSNNGNCHKTSSCDSLPISLSFNLITNSIVRDITSKDSKFFHVNIIGANNFTFQHVNIEAPGDSMNTDGIHVGRSSDIFIEHSIIGTGDDCVSIGDGAKKIHVTNVTCGPGHGISVGSLGRYPKEEPVEGVFVKNCTLINTLNGLRIKTWPGSPAGIATDIHFEDIIMQNSSNPILIDQEYCPWDKCKDGQPSNIKISKVSYKNIRGTSADPLAIILVCSKNHPCEGVEVGNIDLRYEGSSGSMTSKCANINPILTGTQTPKVCSNTSTS